MKKHTVPKYLNNLIKKYPKITGGRKNFNDHNDRIVNTIKLVKKYLAKTNN